MLRTFVARRDQEEVKEEEERDAQLQHEPGLHLIRSLTGPQVGLAQTLDEVFQMESDPLKLSYCSTKKTISSSVQYALDVITAMSYISYDSDS